MNQFQMMMIQQNNLIVSMLDKITSKWSYILLHRISSIMHSYLGHSYFSYVYSHANRSVPKRVDEFICKFEFYLLGLGLFKYIDQLILVLIEDLLFMYTNIIGLFKMLCCTQQLSII
jgi:hypothetical protein